MWVLVGVAGCSLLSHARVDIVQPDGTAIREEARLGDAKLLLVLNENWTLAVALAWSADPPRHTMIGLSNGPNSVCRSLVNKGESLTFTFTPALLRALNHVSGNYSLTAAIHSQVWEIATVEFVGLPVGPEFPDVEWDFQPPPRLPGNVVVTVFCGLVLLPLPFFGWVMLRTVNCKLFPRSVVGAARSIAFLVALGFALGYFVYFWRAVEIEVMLVRCVVALPVLGFLLRGALVARKAEVGRFRRNRGVVKVD